MAKRFTSTEIWMEDWFLEMPTEYKMLWYYMLCKCDHAGVWKPNIKTFESTSGLKVNLQKAIEFFNDGKERIKITDKKNWWVIDFFYFQYGFTFNINNKLHKSIYDVYNQENIDLRTNRGLREVKWWTWSGRKEDFDTLKEKDKVIDNNTLIGKVKNSENGKNQPINFKAQGENLYFERSKRRSSEANPDTKEDPGS